MRLLETITLAGLSVLGTMSLPHAGPAPQRMNAAESVVTVAVQVGREVAGTVAAPPAGRRSITLSAFDTPRWTMAGGRYRARFLVKNEGDVEATVVLTLATPDSLTRVEPSTIRLAPGASAVVTVVTSSVRGQGVLAVGLRATDRDAPEVHATAAARATVLGSLP